MKQQIKNQQEYNKAYKKLEQIINDSLQRNDMIIFDLLNRCLTELKNTYQQFEQKRNKNEY